MLLDLKSRKPVGDPLFTVPEEHGVDKMRFNDGKAAPGGAVIIGRMHADWRKGAPGRLYKWAPLSSPVVTWNPLPARVPHSCQKGKLLAVCTTPGQMHGCSEHLPAALPEDARALRNLVRWGSFGNAWDSTVQDRLENKAVGGDIVPG